MPNSLPDFLTAWEAREKAARDDNQHRYDADYSWWLVQHAPAIREAIEALSNEAEQWRRHGTAYTIPAASDVRQAMDKSDAAIARLRRVTASRGDAL